MKKTFAILLALVVATTCLFAAGGNDAKADPNATTISLWTFPVGGWGDQAKVNALISGFEAANPGIKVRVDYLTYADGDAKVDAAIEGGVAPDLILEGPERLVANWGAKGKMVDISGLFTAKDKSEINAAALKACFTKDGKAYEYPFVMTAHCMAINKNAFEKAGALKYIDQKTRTWTTDNFLKAVDALYKAGYKNVGAIYCSGQGGDQGTRALVNNLYGGTFTDAAHTKYTWNDANNVKALETLSKTPGIKIDPGINGGDEIALFYNGTLQMAFCWNIAQQLNPNSANTGAEKTLKGDDIMFVSFPSQKGSDAKLQGGIWGFGIFDNGDANKIAASKKFIEYMCKSNATAEAVKTSTFFSVRESANGVDLSKIYANDKIMNDYKVLMPLLGDYYQVTTGWAEARTQWWNMLQQVGAGKNISTTVAEYANKANAAR